MKLHYIIYNSVIQNIEFEYNGCDSLWLRFSTNGRINTEYLKLKLMDVENCVQSWDINTKWIDEKEYLKLIFDKKINQAGKTYTLCFTSNAEEGNGVSLINYKLQYKTLENKKLYKGFILVFMIAAILSIIGWCVVNSIKIRIESSFLILWCVVSVLFACSNTMNNVPDESHHFLRAFEVSMGYMLSEMNSDMTSGGRELPLLDTGFKTSKWQDTWETKNAELSIETTFKNFSNTALYNPIAYIPQALGILVARLITNKLIIITYAGRLINWICITFVLYWSIRLIPFGKEMLAIIVLMPMNVHEAFSLSPDGMVVAVSTLMISLVMYLRYQQETELTKKQIVLLYILAIAISLYKIVYLPFCLIYLLIPSERFGNKKKMTVHAIIIALTVVLLNVLWLKLCNKFLTHIGANGELQIPMVLKHPLNYCIAVFRTYSSLGVQFLHQLVGSTLGQLVISTNGILIIMYIALIFKKMEYGIKGITSKDLMFEKVIYGIVVLAIIILTTTSLYVQWTFVGENMILGLQGRYFIALILPIYFCITKEKYTPHQVQRISDTASATIIAFNICSSMAVLFYCLA